MIALPPIGWVADFGEGKKMFGEKIMETEKLLGLTVSSMTKVYADAETLAEETENSMLSDERFHFQLALKNVSGDVLRRVRAECLGDLREAVTLRLVKNVPCIMAAPQSADDYYERTAPGLFPDVLQPWDGKDLVLSPGYWQSVWVTVNGKGGLPAGKHEIVLRVSGLNGETLGEYRYALEVRPSKLAENDLIVTHWMHYDGIAARHGVELFSEAFYEVFGRYLDVYTGCGNTMLLTPLFTPPLDTEPGGERRTAQLVGVKVSEGKYSFDFSALDFFMDFAAARGIRYFEFSHLFTQWGGEYCPKIMAERDGKTERIFGWETRADSAEYAKFLEAFLPALTAFVRGKGLEDRCFVHLTDEPGAQHIGQYLRCRDAVKKHIGGMRTMDALSDYEFYEKGGVDMPAVATPHAGSFLEKGVKQMLIYYCCWPGSGYYSNGFLAMPSQRNRILGIQLYLSGVKGFLHWGFNFYNSGLSLFELNPYEDTNGGGFFPGGDAFMVYPYEKGAAASLRCEVFYDGIQDYLALKALERKEGREYVLGLLREEGVEGLNVYPRSAEWHRGFRRKINAAL